ncbi:hypothetical protein F2Q68_00043297 [Brassica cretica]|uniref:Uncharacterized protein n=1 Tax=Brassica cretica TaxID=69181 RepID=A0A8S9LUP0_BRACR|nr:hypothetical protein F2Q68_00043297 [Brassica cretica]
MERGSWRVTMSWWRGGDVSSIEARVKKIVLPPHHHHRSKNEQGRRSCGVKKLYYGGLGWWSRRQG